MGIKLYHVLIFNINKNLLPYFKAFIRCQKKNENYFDIRVTIRYIFNVSGKGKGFRFALNI